MYRLIKGPLLSLLSLCYSRTHRGPKDWTAHINQCRGSSQCAVFPNQSLLLQRCGSGQWCSWRQVLCPLSLHCLVFPPHDPSSAHYVSFFRLTQWCRCPCFHQVNCLWWTDQQIIPVQGYGDISYAASSLQMLYVAYYVLQFIAKCRGSPIRNSICISSCSALKARSSLMMMVNSLFLRTMRVEHLYLSVLWSFCSPLHACQCSILRRPAAFVSKKEDLLSQTVANVWIF